MRNRPLAVAATLVAMTLGGCGSSDENGTSDEDAVTDTVTTYFSGLAAGNGDEACAQLSGEATRELVDVALTQVPEIGSIDCVKVVEELSGALGEDERQLLEDVEVVDIEVDGTTATATVEGAERDATLIKSGDTWLIDSGFADGATSPETSIDEPETEPTEPVGNTLADTAPALEDAGFKSVGAPDEFEEAGITALGAAVADKGGATFTAAEFATPEDAVTVSKKFMFLEKGGLPLEVDGTTLIYVVKCCVDSGPPPVVPEADVQAFKDAVGL